MFLKRGDNTKPGVIGGSSPPPGAVFIGGNIMEKYCLYFLDKNRGILILLKSFNTYPSNLVVPKANKNYSFVLRKEFVNDYD